MGVRISLNGVFVEGKGLYRDFFQVSEYSLMLILLEDRARFTASLGKMVPGIQAHGYPEVLCFLEQGK